MFCVRPGWLASGVAHSWSERPLQTAPLRLAVCFSSSGVATRRDFLQITASALVSCAGLSPLISHLENRPRIISRALLLLLVSSLGADPKRMLFSSSCSSMRPDRPHAALIPESRSTPLCDARTASRAQLRCQNAPAAHCRSDCARLCECVRRIAPNTALCRQRGAGTPGAARAGRQVGAAQSERGKTREESRSVTAACIWLH